MSEFDPLAEPEEHYCKWHTDDDDCPECGECIECGMCECGWDDRDGIDEGAADAA